jgi:hypothetical protein
MHHKLARIALLAVLLAVVGIPTMPVRASHTLAEYNGFDDFDNVQAGLNPGDVQGFGEFYDFVGPTSCRVTNAFSSSPPNSVLLATGTAGASCSQFDLKSESYEYCISENKEAEIKFKVRFEDADATWGGEVKVLTSGMAWSISFGTAAAFAYVKSTIGGNVVGNNIPGLVPVRGTWYEVTLKNMLCTNTGNEQFQAIVTGYGGSAVTNQNGGTATTSRMAVTAWAGQAGTFVYIDDLTVSGFPIAADAVTDPFPAGFTLVGFDEDYAQKTVIARLQDVGGNQKILTFDPVTLNVINQIDEGFADEGDMACQFVRDGVMAVWQDTTSNPYVAFTACTGTSTIEVNELHIRNSALGAPNFDGTICDPAVGGQENFCNMDLEQDDAHKGNACPTTHHMNPDTANIGQIIATPISFAAGVDEASDFLTGSGSHDYVSIGFAYYTVENPMNVVGSYVQSQINDHAEHGCLVERDYSNNNPVDLCTFRGNKFDGADYVTAIGFSPATTWRLTYSVENDLGITVDDQYLVPKMDQVSQLQTNLMGIGCSSFSNSSLLIDGLGHVNRYNVIGPELGEPMWAEDLVDALTVLPRGVAMSRDGNWGAYAKTSNKWEVFNANNGTVVANGNLPNGDFFAMRLSGAGNDLVIASSTQIARFHVTEFTNKKNVPDNVVCNAEGEECLAVNSDGSEGGAAGPGTSGGAFGGIGGKCGFPGINIQELAAGSGMTQEAVCGWLGALNFMVITAGMAMMGAGGQASGVVRGVRGGDKLVMIMGTMGAIGAFFMNLYFGLITLWLVIFIFVLAAAAITFRRGAAA